MKTASERRPAWVRPVTRAKSYLWVCGECGKTCYYIQHGPRDAERKCGYRYCPWCGQEMGGAKADGEAYSKS